MRDLSYKRSLQKLQNEREKIKRQNAKKLMGITGEKRLEILAECGDAYRVIEEEIAECQSDHIRTLAELYDLSLPKSEEGDYWVRMYLVGDRLILTTLGREVTREKIAKEQKLRREVWGLILSLIATVGSLTVAVLAICLRK